MAMLCNIRQLIIGTYNVFMTLANEKRTYLSSIISRCQRKKQYKFYPPLSQITAHILLEFLRLRPNNIEIQLPVLGRKFVINNLSILNAIVN